MTSRLGDLGSTSYFVSLSFSDVQISHAITPGLEDDVRHLSYFLGLTDGKLKYGYQGVAVKAT